MYADQWTLCLNVLPEKWIIVAQNINDMWFIFNPSMDKQYDAWEVWDEITYHS